MRDQPKDLLVLIPVGMVAILNLVFLDSPKAIAWAKEQMKSLFVGGVCVALVGFLLILLLVQSGCSAFVLVFPTIATLIGIWMFTIASVVKTFYTR